MKFYDEELKAEVRTENRNDEIHIYLNEIDTHLSISSKLYDQYPLWVIEDVIRVLLKKNRRKEQLDQLSEKLINKG